MSPLPVRDPLHVIPAPEIPRSVLPFLRMTDLIARLVYCAGSERVVTCLTLARQPPLANVNRVQLISRRTQGLILKKARLVVKVATLSVPGLRGAPQSFSWRSPPRSARAPRRR